MKHTAERGMIFRHKETKKVMGGVVEIKDNDSIENYEQVKITHRFEEMKEKFIRLRNKKLNK